LVVTSTRVWSVSAVGGTGDGFGVQVPDLGACDLTVTGPGVGTETGCVLVGGYVTAFTVNGDQISFTAPAVDHVTERSLVIGLQDGAGNVGRGGDQFLGMLRNG
jgi:hypothetical protein